MAEYISVNIDRRIHTEIENIVKNKKLLYRTKSEFINEVLRSKVLELRWIQLKEKEIEIKEKEFKITKKNL